MSKKISELTDADTLTGAELAEVVQDGVNKKVTINGFSLLPTVGTGTATGDITGDLDGHLLSIEQDGIEFLSANPTPNNESATLQAYNTTDADNSARITAHTTDTQADFDLLANFDDLTKFGRIQITANASASTITYTADTHTFNGVLNLPTQSAPVSPNDGDIWREDNTNTGLKIRINGVTKTITVS
jgi:hypothetical protein